MKTLGYLALIPMMIFGIRAYAQPGYYPPPANVIYHDDTLTICPPDSLPGEPVVLLAYNILVDSVFFDNLPVTNPTDTLDYIFTFPDLPPGAHSFCVNAVYNQWISDQACDSDTLIYGYELPFLEDWSSGSFETLQWTSSSDNWVISNEEGNPAPAAEFRGDPVLNDYSHCLESYPMNFLGLMAEKIWLDFEVKLDCNQPTANERFRVQIWNWTTKIWITIADFSNSNGSFDWDKRHINIRSVALNKIFKIRFLATGENSDDIQDWLVDNIHIYRSCEGPNWITLQEFEDHNLLDWDGAANWYYNWINWDDGVYSSSIGTGGPVEFDVAARWEPEQLADYSGAVIAEIDFVPAEPSATYSVRIWSGTGPDTLIYDQIVPEVVIGQWNNISLLNPQFIDVSKDLWVGYHVSTPTGYPAGVDDGPAINGYGNMMNFEGWQTLLQINPDLDYNWNISCMIEDGPYGFDMYYNLYRSTNQGGFQLYDRVFTSYYYDNNISLSDHYCYQVEQITINGLDTCESTAADTVCETINVGINQPFERQIIKIYPNPAKKWLNIASEEEILSIKVYNLFGEEVLKLEIGNFETRLDISCLTKGIYYFIVETSTNVVTTKVVILS